MKYLIIDSAFRNAFLSNSRNTKQHVRNHGSEWCYAYDKNGVLVSYAVRAEGKIFNAYFDAEKDERMKELFEELNREGGNTND